MNPASERTSGYFPGLYAAPDYSYNYTAQINHKIRQEFRGPLSPDTAVIIL